MSLFDHMLTEENLYAAAHRAALGKRFNGAIAEWRFHLEEEVRRLRDELSSEAYRPGHYRVFYIYEPKKREIAAAPFRDRVVHQALFAVLEPLFERRFFTHSYACRNGKGTHRALDTAQKFLRARRFILQGDIRKFFPSMRHDVLKRLLRRRVRDPRLLRLCDRIIDSSNSALLDPGRGLPIGNLTSQLWANVYLHELDHFVKHQLRCRYYLRYMDDFLLAGDDRVVLQDWREVMRTFLGDFLGLQLNEGKTQIYRSRGGVTFLGFRLKPTHRRLSRAAVRRVYSRFKRYRGEVTAEIRDKGYGSAKHQAFIRGWQAWRVHAAQGECGGLERKLEESLSNILVLCWIACGC